MPHAMNKNKRLTLVDAVALIAATALGLALSRFYLPFGEGAFEFYGSKLRMTRPRLLTLVIMEWMTILVPCFLTLMFASLALRLRQGRTRRMLRRPGLAATVVTSLVLAFATLSVSLREVTWSSGDFMNFSHGIIERFAELNGVAIGAVWLVLLVARLWRPATDPYECLGRLLGMVWISLSILYGILSPLAAILK